VWLRKRFFARRAALSVARGASALFGPTLFKSEAPDQDRPRPQRKLGGFSIARRGRGEALQEESRPGFPLGQRRELLRVGWFPSNSVKKTQMVRVSGRTCRAYTLTERAKLKSFRWSRVSWSRSFIGRETRGVGQRTSEYSSERECRAEGVAAQFSPV
jgi:hypothetical protein